MGMDALLTPSIVRATAKSLGLEAARLDIHPTTHALVLTLLQRGRPIHIDVPTGRNFTRDEICELLITGNLPDGPGDPPAKSFTHLNAVPTIVGTSPP